MAFLGVLFGSVADEAGWRYCVAAVTVVATALFAGVTVVTLLVAGELDVVAGSFRLYRNLIILTRFNQIGSRGGDDHLIIFRERSQHSALLVSDRA